MKVISICAFMLSICALSPTAAVAKTWWVPDDGTIQYCIYLSTHGDTVIVRPGTYPENISFSGKAITVKSELGPCVTTISGDPDLSLPIVCFGDREDRDSVLDGFTIQNGYNQYGGGIYCYYGSPTIANNIIHNNGASCGAGIYCQGHYHGRYPFIIDNLIYDNTSHAGAGIFCFDCSPTIINCTVEDNLVYYPGGAGPGLYCNENSSPKIGNSIFWDEIECDGTPVVRYSDIIGGWPGEGNINLDPCFVSGLCCDYYLSQLAAGQALDSPCVDAGNPNEASMFLVGTTRTDEVQDDGVVDMGYHYWSPQCQQPVQDIKVNNSDGSLLLTIDDEVSVTISVVPGSMDGRPSEWWVFVERNGSTTWWAEYVPYHDPIWTKSTQPILFAAPTFRAVNSYLVLPPRTLPAGTYIWRFLAGRKDGVLDYLYGDAVDLTVI